MHCYFLDTLRSSNNDNAMLRKVDNGVTQHITQVASGSHHTQHNTGTLGLLCKNGIRPLAISAYKAKTKKEDESSSKQSEN